MPTFTWNSKHMQSPIAAFLYSRFLVVARNETLTATIMLLFLYIRHICTWLYDWNQLLFSDSTMPASEIVLDDNDITRTSEIRNSSVYSCSRTSNRSYKMPAKNPTRTPEEREKAAADRKRQRENLKLKLQNKPLIKTPRQLELERREAAGEQVRGDSKPLTINRKKRVRKPDGSETEHEDDAAACESSDYVNFLRKKRQKLGHFQQQLTEDEASQLEMVNRNGDTVPRLISTIELTPELLIGKNGLELARVLGKQSNSTLIEMLSKLQVGLPSKCAPGILC